MKIYPFSYTGVVMAMLTIPFIASADECSSIRLTGRLNKKKVSGGGSVKVYLAVKNTGVDGIANANVRLELPAGTQYTGSSMFPKIKSHLKPSYPNFYWTDLNLRKKKYQKFDIKVRKSIMLRRI